MVARRIEVGQPVYVQGVAQHRPGLDLWRELTERVSEKLREVKANADEMRRSVKRSLALPKKPRRIS